MSPAARKKGDPHTISAEGPRGGATKVVVTPRASDKKISVQWICGSAREFNVDDLRRALSTVDLNAKMPELWFNLKDTRGSRYTCHVEDGKLTANDSSETPNGWVPWNDLKRSLQASIAELA